MMSPKPGARRAAAAAPRLPAGGAWRSFWKWRVCKKKQKTRKKSRVKKEIKNQRPSASLTFSFRINSKTFPLLFCSEKGSPSTPPFPRSCFPSDRCVCSVSLTEGVRVDAVAYATLYTPLHSSFAPVAAKKLFGSEKSSRWPLNASEENHPAPFFAPRALFKTSESHEAHRMSSFRNSQEKRAQSASRRR